MFGFSTNATTNRQRPHATPTEFKGIEYSLCYKHITPSGVLRGSSLILKTSLPACKIQVLRKIFHSTMTMHRTITTVNSRKVRSVGLFLSVGVLQLRSLNGYFKQGSIRWQPLSVGRLCTKVLLSPIPRSWNGFATNVLPW